jgi:hypothetical protein
MRIDTSYVYDGEHLDPNHLLAVDDATDAVSTALGDIPAALAQQRQILALTDEPRIEPGFQCTSPWDCPFTAHCMSGKPKHWIRRLPRISRAAFDSLRERGVQDIADIPDDFPLQPLQRRIQDVVRSGKAWVSPDLRDELARIRYPIQFLDFETINPAIPLYAGTRPYEKVPFQWSLYTASQNGSITHRGFLFDQGGDPRRAVADSLLNALEEAGSIVAYNASFEIGVISGLADALPDLADPLCTLPTRIVDLLATVRQCYYHADLLGSFSLKQLVPVLVPDCAYDDLGIQDGSIASLEYLRMTAEPDPQERQRIRHDLLEYCKRDTWAMVRIWQELTTLAE